MPRRSDSIMIALVFIFIGFCASSEVVHFDLRCLNVTGKPIDKPDEITWESCTLQCAAFPQCEGYQEFLENGKQVCRLLTNVKRNELGDELVNVRLGPGEFELCPTVEQRRCLCGPGFRLDDNLSDCIDINECAVKNGMCSHKCANTPGSFKCICLSGYTLEKDRRTCKDINECAVKNGMCSHKCANTPGSFKCMCHSGYTLEKDNRTCKDIDECAVNIGGCSDICVNTPGSFQCTCRSGYSLNNDSLTCEDINECAVNKGGCSDICVNTPGSFQCTCLLGFELKKDGRTCR